ncbi:MAG: hypothetical protein ABFS38_09640 [Bacteroidota bacterium]
MRKPLQILLILLISVGTIACNPESKKSTSSDEEQPSMVKKRRDDGTLSSINQVDEEGYVHGVKTNFYEDGVTVHSKISYEHGRKHGPAIWYFKSGQVYEHTNFIYGRKNGLTKRYYDTGELMEEFTYDTGEELPGKKRYNREGDLITK